MNALSLSNRHPSVNGRLPEMDHLLKRVFEGWDVEEGEKEYRVTVDLPGVEQKDIELAVHDGMLSVKAQRERAETAARYSTRWAGRFERSLSIDPDVDVDQISASLKNGVLTVTLPKKPERQPRRIQIE